MFGEFDSESPRVPSPWDSLTPPSSPPNVLNEIPKLVPEADEGNVEYKLQLLSPTPARFARLVTQLKWRLLEGGGQAYYEIGVADSGTLIGLPRDQLEQSLETLEMMAGEIGASVIVVKEIEVSLELSSPARSQVERWEERKRNGRKKDLPRVKGEESPATSATELETELSNTDFTDIEETSSSSPITSPASPGGEFNFIQPFDSALAVFTMDIGEDVADYADNETTDDDTRADYAAQFSTLEISSVYKPRPMKKRATHVTPPQSTHQESAKGRFKKGHPPSKSVEDSVAFDPPESQPEPKGAKALIRRVKRDKRRELKLSTQLSHIPTLRSTEPPDPIDSNSISSCSRDECSDPAVGSAQIAAVGSPAGSESGATTVISKEPRLIVEALVVRKLSLEEAFLDFEGFSLQ